MVKQYDFFISYAHQDRAVATELKRHLCACGWSVWWDPELLAGEHFDREVEDAINSSSYVIVLWSPAAIASDWVRAEAAYALHDRKLISTMIEAGLRLPLRYANVYTVPLSELFETQLERILHRRVTGVGQPPAEMPEERTWPRHASVEKSTMAEKTPRQTVTLHVTASDAAADIGRSVREALKKRDGLVGAGDDQTTTPEILAYREHANADLIREIVLLFLDDIASHKQYEEQWPSGLAVLGLVGGQFPAELAYQTEKGRRRNLEFLRSLKPREGLELDRVLSAIRQIEYDRWV